MTVTVGFNEGTVEIGVRSVSNADPPKECEKCGLSTRFTLAIVCFVVLTTRTAGQICMSVAIVDMVKVEPILNSSRHALISDDICPGASPDTDGNPDGEFDWSETMQGALLSAPYLGYLSSLIVAGRMVDRLGTRIVICLSMVISGAMITFTPFFARTHFALLVVTRVVSGMSAAFLSPAILLLISAWFPPGERSRYSGVIFSSTDLGHLLGAGLSGILANWRGWPIVFYFFGGLVLILTVPCLLLIHDSPAKHPCISEHERQFIVSAVGQQATNKERKNVPWKEILTCAPFWAACFIQFGDIWVEVTMASELPTFTKNILHFDIKTSGYIAALPNVFSLATAICSGFLFHLLRDKNCISTINVYRLFNTLCSMGPAITLVLLTIVGCNSTLTIILIVLIASFGGFYSGTTYLNFMDLGVNYSGTLSGLQHTIGWLPGLISPLLAGHITDDNQTLTAWHHVFLISAVVSALPLLIFLIFGSVEEQPWNRRCENPEE